VCFVLTIDQNVPLINTKKGLKMKYLLQISLAVVALILYIPKAGADGIPAYYDKTGWHVMAEQAQYAAIALRDGKETLLLQVDIGDKATPQEAEKLVWITPVPAMPSQVKVDILRGFPEFSGVEPRAYLKSLVYNTLSVMAASQLYPAFLLPFLLIKAADSGVDGLTVYQRLRSDGVELELLGADSIAALGTHLKNLEVDFPNQGLESLKSYTKPDSCFVVFRIFDLAAYKESKSFSLGVEVTFPSQEGFFPLVASSALPGDQLTVVVTAVGFYTAIEPVPVGLSTNHYVGKIKASPEVQKVLGISKSTTKEHHYTRFVLQAPPKQLTADLRFVPGAPVSTEIAAGWISGLYPHLVVSILLFALLSILAALVCRPVWPKNVRPSRWATVGLGFSNFSTLVGLLIISIITARRLGAPIHRGLRFSLFMSLTFCGFLFVITLIAYVA
jgi:hypothetical protein